MVSKRCINKAKKCINKAKKCRGNFRRKVGNDYIDMLNKLYVGLYYRL